MRCLPAVLPPCLTDRTIRVRSSAGSGYSRPRTAPPPCPAARSARAIAMWRRRMRPAVRVRYMARNRKIKASTTRAHALTLPTLARSRFARHSHRYERMLPPRRSPYSALGRPPHQPCRISAISADIARGTSAAPPPSVRAAAEVVGSGRSRHGEHPGVSVIMAGTPAGRVYAQPALAASGSCANFVTGVTQGEGLRVCGGG